MATATGDGGNTVRQGGTRRSSATLREVARLAGVHPGTASRAMNEGTRGLVNDATAQRVLAAAKQIGYRPNPIARGLKTSRSDTVGVLIPDLTNPLFPPIVRAIQDRLDRDGYTPLITNTDNDPERERSSIEALSVRRIDGLLTATAQTDSAVFADLGIPVVLINRQVPGGRLRSVAPDDRAGVRLAVEHLARLGHTRIAHLAGPSVTSTGALRSESFEDTLRRLGLDPDPALIRTADAMTEAEGRRLCRQLLADDAEFTAIVAVNDLVAVGCFDVFDEEGIVCPQDISVVGFNDMRFADRFAPPLTTIRIPHIEMGVRAAELLLEQIRDPDATARHELLEPTLIVRGSTAPPRV